MNALAIAPEDDAPSITPQDLAAQLLEEHRLLGVALPIMVDEVMASPELREQVLRQVIEHRCRRILEVALEARRQAKRQQTGGGPVGAQRSADLSAWAGAVADSMLGFRLPTGCALGDADRAELGRAMASYATQSNDAATKHRWLQLIQQSLPERARVRDVLSEARLAELRLEARRVDA